MNRSPEPPDRREGERHNPERRYLESATGEMAARMRNVDWSTSRLGPPHTWPQSLHTALSIVLSSRFPTILFWGPDHCLLYNDASIPVLGGKHPHALGADGWRAWGEVWEVIGPILRQVRARGEATWSRDQLLLVEADGAVEERYFTWSHSPISDESGGVGGVFSSVIETTDQVIGARRLRALRALAETAGTGDGLDATARAIGAALSGDPADVAFALVYLLDDGGAPRLGGAAHVDPDHPLALEAWPVAEVLASGEPRLVELSAVRGLPVAPWGAPPTRAMVLPLPGRDPLRPLGAVVVGLSARRPLDDGYRGFLDLVAHHAASALGIAAAYEAERRRAEALAELDRAKTTFFSNVSHEFRTPLTLILGPIEDALRAGVGLDGVELRTTYRNALRLLRLVNALLEFSRLHAGRADARFAPVDLAAFTAELAAMFDPAMRQAGLTYRIACDPIGEPVYVDPASYEKIVLNLLSNALKFTFEGEVAVTLRRRGDRVDLIVRDTGAGVPPGEIPRLFERFHRIEGVRARTHEGSGIGLALVRDLVELHGGTITASSEVGAGTTFTVTLRLGRAHLPAERIVHDAPARADRAAAAPYVQEAMRWIPEEPDTPSELRPVGELGSGRARVIVADDNADMREYLARLLGDRWDVETCADGEAALQAARGAPPDLVVTDSMMPRLDGFGLLAALRADPRTASVPVILLSARAAEEARVEGLQAGADDYLIKPFSARELVARVAAHLQIARLRAIAEAERAKLHDILIHAPIAITLFEGPDHRIALINEAAAAEARGRRRVGVPLAECMPELVGQGEIAQLDHVYQTGQRQELVEHEVQIDRGDGVLEPRWFTRMLQAVRGPERRITGVISVGFEVTEQVVARRVTETALARAEQATRAKDEFLAMLGHELRNPLAPILTALQLLRLRGVETREQTVIERQVDHLVRLVDDLLDVSRIARGKVELQRQPLEVGDVVGRALEMAGPLVEQRRQPLRVDVPAGLVVHADPSRLAQVVANLVTNASKYSDSESPIDVFAERAGGKIRIRIRDRGIGIPREMQARVFDLFEQAPQGKDRARGGLGLGLAIVRNLVRLHGGEVWVDSGGVGQGSEFVVELDAVEVPVVASGPRRRARTNNGDLRRVLVVDDNDDAAQMLARALDEIGCLVRTAHDGPTALQIAPEFRPDLALLDIGLPVMDGYELARRLREQLGARLRLVAVTGYGLDSDRWRSAEAGFEAHLVKPVAVEAVEDLLTR